MRRRVLASVLFLTLSSTPISAQGIQGYYRQPAINGNTIVFVSEGDLWSVPVSGGNAIRLTTNVADETSPAISPDGKTVAFTGRYDGTTDVYSMPLAGGMPKRHSWDAGVQVVGWTNDGKILYTTSRYSTLPNFQLVTVDPANNKRDVVDLAQAWDGSWSGNTLFFTRFSPAARSTRMYTGGTAQNIWKWDGRNEASCLTCDWKGTSRSAKTFNGRVYFLSDRALKTINVWSMNADGKDLKQHTFHNDYEVREFDIHSNKIVYQQGADLRVAALDANTNAVIPITVSSDMEAMRERFVKNPIQYLSDFHIDKTGDKVALIARGMVFVAPVGQGRFVQLPNNGGVRYREMRFAPDGKSLFTLNDRSGEVELWRTPADGVGTGEQLTKDGEILRWDLEVSPDGKFIAHDDKNAKLWLYDVASKTNKLVIAGKNGGPGYWWTPDSRSLILQTFGPNTHGVLQKYDVGTGAMTSITTDRYHSTSPAITPDGAWLYFLSDRTFNTSVGAPWGRLQPEPYFNNRTKIYAMQLKAGGRFPFAPKTEIPWDSTQVVGGLFEVPISAGNYSGLTTDGKRLYFISRTDVNSGAGAKLNSLEFKNEDIKVETFAEGVSQYELSGDDKKILFRKGDDLYVVGAGAKAPGDLTASKVDLSGWMLRLDRRDELKNLYADAWRLERDYFYDPGMHGLDWKAIRRKYEPLAARVGDRTELNDVVSQMVAELSALHINVGGGDLRSPVDTIPHSALGAVLEPLSDGWRVARIYQNDPEVPGELSPLAQPGVGVSVGDVIRSINGVALTSVGHPADLLLGKAGKQVLLELTNGRKAIVYPLTVAAERNLRYSDWEYSRRLMVDSLSGGKIGYVHLRAMGAGDINQFARDYYPQFTKQALIVDVRNNGGGNIDSWVLEKLMRRAWHYWSDRVGDASWNMQYAFRGPMATIVNEGSGSDGEIFPEGFRKLGLGKVFGTRTWGGEIWLTSSNFLADRGIATAAEFGVFADGKWLIEQHGVDPDVVVDNLPAATFDGADRQLEVTVRHLLDEVAKRPNPVPVKPAYPNKATAN